jgi:hypothetical protein
MRVSAVVVALVDVVAFVITVGPCTVCTCVMSIGTVGVGTVRGVVFRGGMTMIATVMSTRAALKVIALSRLMGLVLLALVLMVVSNGLVLTRHGRKLRCGIGSTDCLQLVSKPQSLVGRNGVAHRAGNGRAQRLIGVERVADDSAIQLGRGGVGSQDLVETSSSLTHVGVAGEDAPNVVLDTTASQLLSLVEGFHFLVVGPELVDHLLG